MSNDVATKPEPPPDPRAYAEIDTVLSELEAAEAGFQARGPDGAGVAGWRAAAVTASAVFSELRALSRDRPALVWLRDAIRCCQTIEDKRRREGSDPDGWGLALCGQTAGEMANLYACWTGRYPESEASAIELAETLDRELAWIRREAFHQHEWNDAVWRHFAALVDSLPAADNSRSADAWLSAVEERLAQSGAVNADQAQALKELKFGVRLVRQRLIEPAPVRAPYRRVRVAAQEISKPTTSLATWRWNLSLLIENKLGRLAVMLSSIGLTFVFIGWLNDLPARVSLALLLAFSIPSAVVLIFVLAWTWAMDKLAAKHPKLRRVLGPMLLGVIAAMLAWIIFGFSGEFSMVCGAIGMLSDALSSDASN